MARTLDVHVNVVKLHVRDGRLDSLGSRIRDTRKQRRLTQEMLGEKVGVSLQTISRWETGQDHPRGPAVFKVAEVLEVTADFLLKGGVDDAAPVEQTDPTPSTSELRDHLQRQERYLAMIPALREEIEKLRAQVSELQSKAKEAQEFDFGAFLIRLRKADQRAWQVATRLVGRTPSPPPAQPQQKARRETS